MRSESVNDIVVGTALNADSPIVLIIFVAAMSLLPLLMLGVTSFVKLSVVFGIVRNALGLGQIPSAGVTTLLALALTANIMAPVVEQGAAAIQAVLEPEQQQSISDVEEDSAAQKDLRSKLTLETLIGGTKEAVEPLKCFLAQNAGAKERKYFAEVHRDSSTHTQGQQNSLPTPDSREAESSLCEMLEHESWSSLIPAFVVSELKAAFVIGFRIFIPFVVIDLVVANILMGLGMMMVSPASISLPFKILLFVMSDGWLLLCQSLVQSYH